MSTWISNSYASEILPYSIEHNTSDVKISLIVSWNFSSWANDNPAWYIRVKKNGVVVSDASAFGTANFNVGSDGAAYSSGNQTVVTRTFTIPHEADGTCTITWEAGYEAQHKGEGYETTSGSLLLTPIPRATTPVLNKNSIDIGESINITLTSASQSFTHKIKYSIGNNSGIIDSSNLAGNRTVTWNTSNSSYKNVLASALPTSTSGTCNIIVETYSNNELIGSKIAPITIRVPNDGDYISSAFTINAPIEDNIVVINSGLDKSYFYPEYSKLNCSCSATPGLGTYISSYSVTVTYNGAGTTESFTTNNFVTNTMPSGTTSVTISMTCTDARGRTSTSYEEVGIISSEQIEVYVEPYVNSLSGSGTGLNYEGLVVNNYCAVTTWTPNITGTVGAKYKVKWYLFYDTSGNAPSEESSTTRYKYLNTYSSDEYSDNIVLTDFNILELGLPVNIGYTLGVKISDGIEESNQRWGNAFCIKGALSPSAIYNQHDNDNIEGTTEEPYLHFYNKLRVNYNTDGLITGIKEVYYYNKNNKINLNFDASHFIINTGYVDLTFTNTSILVPDTTYNISIVFNTNTIQTTKTSTFSVKQCPSLTTVTLVSTPTTIKYYTINWSGLKFRFGSSLTEDNYQFYDFDITTGVQFYLNELAIPNELTSTIQYSASVFEVNVERDATFYSISDNFLNLDLNNSNELNLNIVLTNLFGKIIGTASTPIVLDFLANPSVSFRAENEAKLYFTQNDHSQIILANNELSNLIRETMNLSFYVKFYSYNNKTYTVKMQIARLQNNVLPANSDWVDFYADNVFTKTLPISNSLDSVPTEDVVGPITVREIKNNYYIYFRVVIDNTIVSDPIGPYYPLKHTSSQINIEEISYDSDTNILTIIPNGSDLGYDITYASTCASGTKIMLDYSTDPEVEGATTRTSDIDSNNIYSTFVTTAPITYSNFPSSDQIWTHNYFRFRTNSSIKITYSNNEQIITQHISYSKPVLTYNQAPTVAYRPNFLGINNDINATLDTSTILAIHDYGNRKNINLISAEKTSTINLLDGSLENFIIDGGSWD